MEKEDKNVPFPQANDFEKIYSLICITEEEQLNDKNYLMELLSLGTERQIAYYISACEFLGVITHDKKFTKIGLKIREANLDLQILMICKIIVSSPVFGEAFFMKYLYNASLKQDDIAQMIGIIYKIDNYEVCSRRASTVIKWIEWIEEHKL